MAAKRDEWLIRNPRPQDLLDLANLMREADRQEVLASAGHSPYSAVADAVERSIRAWTLELYGEVAALFGVGELRLPPPATFLTSPNAGCIWMLTGQGVDEMPKAFLRACEAWRPVVLSYYPVLINFIDARHARALRWAEWFGFKVYPPKPFGLSQLPFHPIVLTR